MNYKLRQIRLLGKVSQPRSGMVRVNIHVVSLMIEKHLAINFAQINPISPFCVELNLAYGASILPI